MLWISNSTVEAHVYKRTLGFWIPIVSGIPDSLSCIPDSATQVPDSIIKISRILKSLTLGELFFWQSFNSSTSIKIKFNCYLKYNRTCMCKRKANPKTDSNSLQQTVIWKTTTQTTKTTNKIQRRTRIYFWLDVSLVLKQG